MVRWWWALPWSLYQGGLLIASLLVGTAVKLALFAPAALLGWALAEVTPYPRDMLILVFVVLTMIVLLVAALWRLFLPEAKQSRFSRIGAGLFVLSRLVVGPFRLLPALPGLFLLVISWAVLWVPILDGRVANSDAWLSVTWLMHPFIVVALGQVVLRLRSREPPRRFVPGPVVGPAAAHRRIREGRRVVPLVPPRSKDSIRDVNQGHPP